MIANNAGGYVYGLDPFKTLERFLILGSEGGTYYVAERKLTKDNALNVMRCIEADGKRAVDLIVKVSDKGLAPKNDPAIFALALAASAKDPATRAVALQALPKVCRIPTHLFHFIAYVRQFRGLGRGLKRALGDWYNQMPVEKLAYECVKYQSRDGWSNADVLRLSHPKTADKARNAVYKWIVDGWSDAVDPAIPPIPAFEAAKTNPADLTALILAANLSREMLPTEALTKPEVWEALLEKMPLTAMIRNLGNMSKCGLLKPLSSASRLIIDRLHNDELLHKARIHPIAVLIALKTYASGRGVRGSGTWDAVSSVVDALDDAFYLAFNNIQPTGKRFIVGVDVSGSMRRVGISGMPMSAAEGAAAMALACIKTEQDYEIVCFDTKIVSTPKLTKQMGLKQLEKEVCRMGGGTDCSQPMLWATKNKIETDVFLILTDNETWAGAGHPSQVMRDYRNKINPSAKIINLGMTATACTVNDPNDVNSLDIAGFDASVPQVISGFVKS